MKPHDRLSHKQIMEDEAEEVIRRHAEAGTLEEVERLGEFGCSLAVANRPLGQLVLRDPPEHGWDLVHDSRA